MEQLNKVILRGIIGMTRVSNVADTKLARMSVATNLAYRGKDGCPIIETTWHNVVAFDGKDMCELESLGKGDKVEITGRIRNQRYTNADGTESISIEILASRITKLETDEPLQYQM